MQSGPLNRVRAVHPASAVGEPSSSPAWASTASLPSATDPVGDSRLLSSCTSWSTCDSLIQASKQLHDSPHKQHQPTPCIELSATAVELTINDGDALLSRRTCDAEGHPRRQHSVLYACPCVGYLVAPVLAPPKVESDRRVLPWRSFAYCLLVHEPHAEPAESARPWATPLRAGLYSPASPLLGCDGLGHPEVYWRTLGILEMASPRVL
jgi:hypothetical protein